MTTNIAWTNETWNPVTGCSHVSAGCEHCYAELLSLRHGWSGDRWTAPNARKNVRLHSERLDQPLRWRKPRMIFVNSMSDLFHDQVPDAFVAHVFAVMAAAYQHTFQILTKRPQRMRNLLSSEGFWTLASLQGVEQWWGPRELAMTDLGVSPPLSNVWLGVSVEDQKNADERIPLLLETPAAIRFLSCEPLLGPIEFPLPCKDSVFWGGLHWVITGGESGPGYRLMDIAWAQSLRAQCAAAGVPFFMKQDSGPRPGMQGRIPDALWVHEFPQSQEQIPA